MPINEALLPEFDQEMANTRRVLERVPVEKSDWKPHPKSGTLGWLAGHVSNLPLWAQITMQTDHLDLAQPFDTPKAATTNAELLKAFDEKRDAARAAITAATDEQFVGTWTLRHGDHEIFSMPRVAVLRSMVMNHLIHHRGQLTVYLRLNDIAVPGMYGPSADES